jgi:PhzF family phenazine biosynthesis protein
MRVYTVNAFVKDHQGGNPAGVVLLETALSDTVMLQVAKKMGYSETAFVQQVNATTYNLRFFTPAAEVDLCGHATIASFTLLRSLNKVGVGTYQQETKAGNLMIRIFEDEVFMEMAMPTFHEEVSREAVAASLGILEGDLLQDYPVQKVSTGLLDILVPVRSLQVLTGIKPDFEQIKKISQENQVVGYHVFTFDTGDKNTLRVRNFAPLYDIDEESATGTSNGALMAYLKRYHQHTKDKLYFEQGYEMHLPSEIGAYMEADGRVFVGGKGMILSQLEINP